MKKFILLFITGIMIIASCQRKTVPVITSRTTQPSAPDTISINRSPDPAIGQAVYTNRCGRCHGLPETGKYTVKRWGTIMESMAPRARLDKQQTRDVTAYVNANAKTE